ncbi:hypothetical protein [Echinicola strongylocentroti]|nr:hypothetical protein [Echinicola strongylocentroti]
MKKLNLLFLMLIGASVMFTSCSDDDNPTPDPTPDPDDELVLDENIAEDMTLASGNVYTLASRVSVLDGVTLTIEPGVIIKGEAGSGANATALVIARGAKIMAEGTAEQPIIFTTVADEIQPGEVYHEDGLSPEQNGLWGGLLILGRAPISVGGDNAEAQIEGIPPSDTNGLYGGSDVEDDSGVLKYVSIRHGGANIGDGNEINGLTLGGVGSATTVENVEVVANNDDGIEWFGGTVSVKNAVVWNAGDDAIDTDQSWNGTLDNFIIVNAGDKSFELDGPEGSYVDGNFTLTNGSIIAGDAAGLVDNDENTNVNMSNIYFTSVMDGQTFDELPTVATEFSNFEVTLPEGGAVADFFLGGSADFTNAVAEGENTVGADKSVFAGWSWTSVSGSLDILN